MNNIARAFGGLGSNNRLNSRDEIYDRNYIVNKFV